MCGSTWKRPSRWRIWSMMRTWDGFWTVKRRVTWRNERFLVSVLDVDDVDRFGGVADADILQKDVSEDFLALGCEVWHWTGYRLCFER